MKSADAAASQVLPNWEIQESGRKEKGRYIFCCNISRSFRGSHRSSGRRRKLEGRRKQLSLERVHIDEHEEAAAPVGIYRVFVIAVAALPVPDSAGRILV